MNFDDWSGNEFFDEATKIPDDFKLGLAQFVINFARLELAVDHLIWWAAGIESVRAGRRLTVRMDIRPKTEMAKSLLAELSDTSPSDLYCPLMPRIAKLTKFRNTVVHGWWMAFGENSVALSAKPNGRSEDGALHGGEMFTPEDVKLSASETFQIERDVWAIMSGPAPSLKTHKH